MYRKGSQGWLKHLDFTVLNLIALVFYDHLYEFQKYKKE